MALTDSWIRSRCSSGRNGAGGLLDQLLVAALHRVVAAADDDYGAVGVGQDLRLDVAVALDTAAVRAWAAANGLTVSRRGRIKDELLEVYRAAGN